MKGNKVRYKYAFNESCELVSIERVLKDGSKYYCPECHDEMIPRKGKYNADHFAHKKSECKYDHYLHTIAELIIERWYNNSKNVCLSVPIREKCPENNKCFFFKDGRNCVQENNSKPFNLKQWFSICEREKPFNFGSSFLKPDLLLYNDKKPENSIFIEICVTHPCEPEKINSNIRIIEIVIKNEEDIESVIKNNLFKVGDNMRLFNFRGKDQIGNNIGFKSPLQKFCLFPSKKVHVDYYFDCHKINIYRGIFELILNKDDFTTFTSTDYGFFDVAIAMASQHHKDLKHCNLCKFQRLTFMGDNICKLYKKRGKAKLCSDNNALECSDFQRDENRINQCVNILEEYKREFPVIIRTK